MIIKSTSNIENFLSQKEIKDVLAKIVNLEQQLNQIINSQFNINGTLTQSGLIVTGVVQFPTNSIDGSQIIDGSIPTTKISNSGTLTINGLNVTSTNVTFQSGSINGNWIIDYSIPTTKISNSGTLTINGLNVTSTNVTFQSGSINGNWIIDYSIPTTKINNSGTLTVNGLNVTSTNVTFQSGSINGNWIIDYSIPTTKINNSGTLTVNGLNVTSTNVTFQNNSINGSWIKDYTIPTSKINNNGTLTVNGLNVTSTNVTFQSGSINGDYITNNTITTQKLADGQVTAQKIQQLDNNLVFSNTVSGVGIYWNNKNNTSDYQFIKYYQDASDYSPSYTSYEISGSSSNNGTLVIGVESDLNNTAGDQVVIRTGQRLIIDQNTSKLTSQDPISIVEFWQKGTQKARIDPTGAIFGNKVYNAVWNDLAELRDQETTIEPGYVQFMNEQTGKLTKKQHKYAVGIVSDTYGIILGLDSKSKKIKKGQVPIQISGRVLQYFSGKLKVGDQVCQQKDGTIRKMKWWEKILFPERMLGVVDEIPMYETWGEENIKVNGRIWIKVK